MIAFNQIKFNKILLSAKDAKGNDLNISGYYIAKPQIKISQKWADDKRVLNEDILAAFNFIRLAGATGTALEKAFDKFKGKVSGGNLFQKTENGSTVIGTIAKSALAGLGGFMKAMGGENLFRTSVAVTQAWQGSEPPTVDLDIILMDELSQGDAPIRLSVLNSLAAFLESTGGPTYMGSDDMAKYIDERDQFKEKDKPGYGTGLLNILREAEIPIAFEGWKAPSNWSNANFGIGGVGSIINGSGTSNHLIGLIYYINSRQTVNIPHFWVVDSFHIETSDQLYSTPVVDLDSSEDLGYKWIKLAISLKGATVFPANWIKKLYMPNRAGDGSVSSVPNEQEVLSSVKKEAEKSKAQTAAEQKRGKSNYNYTSPQDKKGGF